MKQAFGRFPVAQNKQQAQKACPKEAQFYAQHMALSSNEPTASTK